MEKVFIGFAFRDEDRDLASDIESLLASRNIRMTTGEHLGGDQLTDAVRARIDEADALIGLLTRREQLASGGWTTHQWVLDELGYARSRDMHAIAIVEDGVKLEGAYAQHEYIPFDRAQPLSAFLKLAETIHTWEDKIGQTLVIQIQPNEAAEFAALDSDVVKCQYRFFRNGEYTDWRTARVVEAPGGTLIYVKGMKPGHSVQVTLNGQQAVWRSIVAPQWVQVHLKQQGQ